MMKLTKNTDFHRVLMLVAVVVVAIPARRASRLNPIDTLRGDSCDLAAF
jgi:hypothetical protein